MRRLILKILIVLIVLFAAILGIGWYLLEDEAFLKSQLSKLTLKYTGRELAINGPLLLDLGSEIRLEASDIHFANAEWAAHPDMASVGKLLISFEIASLFGPRYIFPDAAIDDCSVYLERNNDGVANWSMGPEGESQAEPEPEPEPEPDKPGSRQWPVWIKDLAIQDCELDVTSTKLEEPLVLKLSDLTMQHHDDNRWAGQGSGSLNDYPLALDGWFAPFSSVIYGGPLDHELAFSWGQVSLNSSGTIKDVKTGTGANLSARLRGTQIETILQEFKLPLFTEGDFDFTTKLNTEGDMTKVDIDGDLGSLEARANGELDRLIRPTKGNIKLSIDGPNLGALAKIFGVEGLIEDAFSHESHATLDGTSLHFRTASLKTSSDHLNLSGHFSMAPHLAGTELDVEFNTSEAGRWTTALGKEKQELGPLSLNGKLKIGDQGLMAIKAHVAQANTLLDVDGTLGSLPDAFHPDLQISLNSPNLKPLASVWGLTEIPERPVSIQGQFGLLEKRLNLGNVQVKVADSNAKIDGTLNLDNRFAGSDIVLDLNIANAERLGLLFGREGLPNQPIQLGAEIKPEGEGLAFKIKDGNLGEIQLDLEGHIADLQQPMGINGNFDISLPRLGDLSFLIPGTELPDAPFTASGELITEEERVYLKAVHVDLAGNRATIDGHINLVKRYAGSKLTFDLDIKNADALGKLFGKDGLPNQPVKLSAAIEPVGKGLAFKVNDGNLGDMQLDLDGKIADLDQPTGVDAQFDIKLLKLSDVAFLVPGRELPDIPFSANGRLVNEKTRTKLDQVQLSLGKIMASVDGNLHPDNSFQLSIKAAGPDISKLDVLAGTSLPASPFSLTADLNGNPSEFALKKLDLTLGTSQLTGNLNIGLGDIFALNGNIVSPHLDLSHWYPGEEPEQKPDPPSSNATREWMFDDTPVMRLAEHKLDIDLDLVVDTLVLGNTIVKSIDLEFLLTHQLLKLSPFTFKGTLGGNYNGEFILDGTSGTPTMHLDMHGKDVRLGLASTAGQDPMTYPPLEIEAKLDGAGATRRELVSSLNGKYVSYLGKGQLASSGMDLLFSDFLTQLFTTLNPFAETSEYTQLDCAVMAAEATDGLIKVFPVIFHTEQLTILSEGTIDMNTEKLDLSFNTKPRTGIGLSTGMIINPLIKVGGRLTTPAVEMDPEGTLVSGGLAVATIGISLLAKSVSDRWLSSPDPCGDARKAIENPKASK
jgi:uncharacterized protein involved in outer membrane biogenesis